MQEILVLAMFSMLSKPDSVVSDEVKSLVEYLRKTGITRFHRAFLEINKARRIDLKRIVKGIDNTLETQNVVINIKPDTSDNKEKQSTLAKIFKKLLDDCEISKGEMKLLREETGFTSISENYSPKKTFLKYMK